MLKQSNGEGAERVSGIFHPFIELSRTSIIPRIAEPGNVSGMAGPEQRLPYPTGYNSFSPPYYRAERGMNY